MTDDQIIVQVLVITTQIRAVLRAPSEERG